MGTRYDAAADERYRAGRAHLRGSVAAHRDANLVAAVIDAEQTDAGQCLAALTITAAERARLDDAEIALVDRARAAGASWSQIAATLGLASRQGAEQYYQRLRKARQQSTDTGAGAVTPAAPPGERVTTEPDRAPTPHPERQQTIDSGEEVTSVPATGDEEPLEVYLAELGGGAHVIIIDGQRVGWARTSTEGTQVGTTSATALAHTQEDGMWAAHQLAARALAGHHGPVRMQSGPLLDHQGRVVETTPGSLTRWQLQRGRVPGRTDVMVRGRTVGWLQQTRDGFTAHTTEGPLDHAPAERTRAALHVLAALWAPLELPDLGPEATKARRVRARAKNEKPLCPYDEHDLARAAAHPEKVDDTDWYRVRVTDHLLGDTDLLGYVRREHTGRTWGAWKPHPRRPDTDVDRQVVHHAKSRTAAIDQLLAVPGPLWADPTDTITH